MAKSSSCVASFRRDFGSDRRSQSVNYSKFILSGTYSLCLIIFYALKRSSPVIIIKPSTKLVFNQSHSIRVVACGEKFVLCRVFRRDFGSDRRSQSVNYSKFILSGTYSLCLIIFLRAQTFQTGNSRQTLNQIGFPAQFTFQIHRKSNHRVIL